MSVHLITGMAGYEHVTSADHGALHAAIMGGGEFVLEGGEQFACQVISNNKVRIFDGEALMQGRHIRIDRNTYEETTHDNGVQGYKRIDLIVFTYEKNESSGVENVTLDVIKGTPSEGTPEVPAYETGDILNNGESKNQMPLYKIPFDGLSIGEPVALFSTVPTLETMKAEVDAEVEAKKTELDEKFSTLEESVDEKIAEAGKPLSSDADDWGLIANYGEYSADAKTVGEEFEAVDEEMAQILTALASKLNNTGVQHYKEGRLLFDRDVTPNSGSYTAAPIILQTVSTDAGTDGVVSGVGFHNMGAVAGLLYLDNDGHLKFVRNSGVRENITDGNNITYESDGYFYATNIATGVKKKLGSGELSIELLGTLSTKGTMDCSNLDNFEELTDKNFLLVPNTAQIKTTNAYGDATWTLGSHSYDASTGVLTAPTLNFTNNNNSIYLTVNVYCIRIV